MILVLNCGSSSIKFGLFSRSTLNQTTHGILEAIGSKRSNIQINHKNSYYNFKIHFKDHYQGLTYLLEKLNDLNIISPINNIEAIGHRIVHGGDKYKEPIKINSNILKNLEELNNLAPLHNPHNLNGVLICKKIFAHIPQIAVFDTSYHNSLPDYASSYAIPKEWVQKYKIKKYGFHGISHEYIYSETKRLIKKENIKMITCHIGNGISVAAIKNGKSIDTTMGFTPLAGIPMGTRCGDIDPSIPLYLINHKKLKAKDIEDKLNTESGLYGLSKASSDFRDIMNGVINENKNCQLAYSVLLYKLIKTIGSYITVLKGLDTLVFTGGIGENCWQLREDIISELSIFDLKVDKIKNKKNILEISSSKSSAKIYAMHTDEALQIASYVQKILF